MSSSETQPSNFNLYLPFYPGESGLNPVLCTICNDFGDFGGYLMIFMDRVRILIFFNDFEIFVSDDYIFIED